jgi:hypothetical protein
VIVTASEGQHNAAVAGTRAAFEGVPHQRRVGRIGDHVADHEAFADAVRIEVETRIDVGSEADRPSDFSLP